MPPNAKETLLQSWKESKRITDENLLAAFLKVAREDFVPWEAIDMAYQDHPLPIGHEQTISQPTTVMLMLQLLEVKKHHNVLEIGAGSGYNAAILSKLARCVCSLEWVEALAVFAKNNLRRSHISNVEVFHQDGKAGYPPLAPFDRIILTAAASHLPPPLFSQLADDGVMVAPVGVPHQCEMLKIHKSGGTITTTRHGRFSFVPLV